MVGSNREIPIQDFEAWLGSEGESLPYPRMRSVAAPVTSAISAGPRRRPAPAWLTITARRLTGTPVRMLLVVTVVVLIAGLAAVLSPGARTAIASFFGLTHIVVERTDSAPSSALDERTRQPAIAGRATLVEARALARLPIGVPGYPANLGAPHKIYFQDLEPGQQVVFVYRNGADGIGPNEKAPILTLFQFKTDGFFHKVIFPGTLIEETTVGEAKALWFEGVLHELQYLGPDGALRTEMERTVEGNTLAWEVGDITYRLETLLSMGEAVKAAESIHRLP